MKLKTRLFAVLASAALVGGATAGILASKNALEAFAADGDYKIAGSFTNWETDPANMTDAGGGIFTYTRTFARGDEFKVIDTAATPNWYGGKGDIGGTGASFFSTSDGNNVYCKISGNYTIQFDSSDQTFDIVDNTAESTYSYVLTTFSDYTCAHLYNEGGSYSAWASTPAVADVGGGVAYNLKLTYNEKDFYGIYRISDRYLADFDNLILKKDGDVSGTYSNQSDTFTIAGTAKVYSSINDAKNIPAAEGSDSDLYKAADFLYKLANARASHVSSLNSLTYGYSFCGISAGNASTLLTAYNTLKADEGIAAIFTNSLFNTYDHDSEDVGAETTENYRANYSIAEIMALVSDIASGAGTNDIYSGYNSETSNSLIAIIAVSSVMLVAGVAVISARKRRKNF